MPKRARSASKWTRARGRFRIICDHLSAWMTTHLPACAFFLSFYFLSVFTAMRRTHAWRKKYIYIYMYMQMYILFIQFRHHRQIIFDADVMIRSRVGDCTINRLSMLFGRHHICIKRTFHFFFTVLPDVICQHISAKYSDLLISEFKRT